jgi:hypothetical protein
LCKPRQTSVDGFKELAKHQIFLFPLLLWLYPITIGNEMSELEKKVLEKRSLLLAGA